jgi:hypothetical protein
MHLLYYDEVKYQPPTQTSFWLGGICAEDKTVPDLETAVTEIVSPLFGSKVLSKETEIHGIELCRGKGNFKHVGFDERMEVLKALLAIIAREDVFRIKIEIRPKNMIYNADSHDETGFMYLVEHADSLFKSKETLGMIFGDYDEPAIGKSVASLSQFRSGGTYWRRGKDISNIIDTVHFARSHHSRMIQLADVFLYCYQFHNQGNETVWRKAIDNIIVESGMLQCTRSKTWPYERYWYQ